ncbi:hypothetical protein SKAU_G00384840 [Synaphobranchus kaupii]|uniref:Reverse transcriptase domain-containing protein n=1 Tax=Synaphobranchus kaupii TaxID=118154 RepID=A0A9Q1EEC6_SYNKA|nr:hypothetical protein SKAU_G00384840 [Synaphobranchus kaupii]
MRIHWEYGPRLYNSATEAAEDMRKRGYSLDPTQPAETDWEKWLNQGARWSGGDGGRSSAHSKLIFSKVDLVRGYHQVPVHPPDVPKPAVITPFGLFEFCGCRSALRTLLSPYSG